MLQRSLQCLVIIFVKDCNIYGQNYGCREAERYNLDRKQDDMQLLEDLRYMSISVIPADSIDWPFLAAQNKARLNRVQTQHHAI